MTKLNDKDLITSLQRECEKLKQENAFLKQLLQANCSDCNEQAKEQSPSQQEPKFNKLQNQQSQNSPQEQSQPLKNTSTSNNLLTVTEKISLYRSLFRGREDVYAARWEAKSGRAGYSPACVNEWDRRVCRKPQIKCAACTNRKLLSITDKVIYNHLTGKQMIGIYPLRQDESCHFLAVDFDKTTWREDAGAFVKACRRFSVPVILERSQSGNGAHVWLFFAEPIAANLARSLGIGLLTQVMQEQHTLSLDSYDRLFPNQDTLPKGGFGNLIALPLQGAKRKEGNSLFLDDDLEPQIDQWHVLATINPMKQNEVLALLDQLNEQGGLLDVRVSETDEEHVDPWISPPPKQKYPTINAPLPQQIELVLANLLYIPHKNLPPILINRIKKIAAFQNPEFYQAQKMRMSTYGKPRIIGCAEEFPEHVGLPRGCMNDLISLLEHYDVKISVREETIAGKSIEINFRGILRPEQEKAFRVLIQNRYGVLAAATAFGKTIIAAKIIAERKINTLVLVHRQQLLEQWRERLSAYFNVPASSIGVIGGGRNKPTGSIDIAMLQSLSKQTAMQSDETLKYGQVIVDECHHLSAFSFEQVLKKVRARYILGLTATPIRKDGHHPIILMQCGPILYRVDSKDCAINNRMQQKIYIRQTSFTPPCATEITKISDLYVALINCEVRNEQIFNDVMMALKSRRVPLLLTQRTAHLDWFADRFKSSVEHVFVLQGGMKKTDREAIFQKLMTLPDGAERLILATGSYIGEGFDDPKLDTLFLTMPISWQGTLQQYVGRLHRQHQNKKDVLVYDYADVAVPSFYRMYQKRLKKYRAMGYVIED